MKALRTFVSAFALFFVSIFVGGSVPPKSPDAFNQSLSSATRAKPEALPMDGARTGEVTILTGKVAPESRKMQGKVLLKAAALSRKAGYGIAATPQADFIAVSVVARGLGENKAPAR